MKNKSAIRSDYFVHQTSTYTAKRSAVFWGESSVYFHTGLLPVYYRTNLIL